MADALTDSWGGKIRKKKPGHQRRSILDNLASRTIDMMTLINQYLE
jgi:hypothetical protein